MQRWPVAAVAVLAACRVDGPVDVSPRPTFEALRVEAGPHNVLSAVVYAAVRDADSVRIAFRPADAISAAIDSITPAVAVVDGKPAIPILGLMPSTSYDIRVIAYGADAVTTSEPLSFQTGALPLDLPSYTASGLDPSPGYVVFGAGDERQYGVVIDNTGRVVWYRLFPSGQMLSFTAQPNGHYAARPMTPSPLDIDLWLEMDPLGRVTRTLGCASGMAPRLHDILLKADGSYWIMCDDVRTVDLTPMGGVVARVTGTAIQHIAPTGQLAFSWTAFDHFAITDLPLAERIGANVNWTHGNAIDVAPDGNVIISFRNLNEITKINTTTGAVMWRFGGARNQFTFLGAAARFTHQHSARMEPGGGLLILDNLGDPTKSAGEAWQLDEDAHTASVVQSFAYDGISTMIGGSVQRVSEGRTLVSFGTAGRVAEYDAAGQVQWSISGNPGYIFRAQRIRSLYSPGVGDAR